MKRVGSTFTREESALIEWLEGNVHRYEAGLSDADLAAFAGICTGWPVDNGVRARLLLDCRAWTKANAPDLYKSAARAAA